MSSIKRNICMVYPNTESFSGQTAATLEILKVFSKSDRWNLIPVIYPNWERKKGSAILSLLKFLMKLLKFWTSFFKLVVTKNAILYINHTQSLASFVRTGLPHLIISYLNLSSQIVVSLHGHVFMEWESDDFKHKFFKLLIKRSSYVTVLGDKQKDKLVNDYNIDEKKVLIVNNPSEFNLLAPEENTIKHTINESEPIKLLHLSLLIESKGFVKYMEVLESISKEDNTRPIEAILCGPLLFTKFCTRFKNETEASDWIDEKVKSINTSSNVKVKWIKGAFGEEKENLFKGSHVFVFPSQYPVEAQPLVLIEAMSAGCAIITSNAGEIEEEVKNSQAIIIKGVTNEKLENEIRSLIKENDKRIDMSVNSLKRAKDFSLAVYEDRWEGIFTDLHNAN